MSEIKLEYPDEKDYENPEARAKASTVSCSCGNRELLVNWINGPWVGGFLKLTCSKCQAESIVFDDFS